MANKLPPKLRTPEISRYATRAAQVEKAKPVVAYWCNYWVVNQILSKGLHTADADCRLYTTQLMDKLEEVKAENATNDAIIDDLAGQAYIEQFALEVFQRADKAVEANVVSKQTADTFQAAANFLELLRIWGELDQEIMSKAKYAKFHAVRISKAIQAGEDPNASNPRREAPPPSTPPVEAAESGNVSPAVEERPSQSVRQASVEDDPDDLERFRSTFLPTEQPQLPSFQPPPPPPPQSISPPLVPTPPTELSNTNEFYTGTGPGSDVSPLEPELDEPNPSGRSEYFPPVPPSQYQQSQGLPPTGQSPQPTLPPIPKIPTPPQLKGSNFSPPAPRTGLAQFAPPPQNIIPPNIHAPASQPASSPGYQSAYNQTQPHYQQPGPPLQSPPSQIPPASAPQWQQQPRAPNPVQPARTPSSTVRAAHPSPNPNPAPPSFPTSGGYPQGEESYNNDEEAVMKAQKHARWAISALNFEDVKTAVKELRNALDTLVVT